MGVVFGWFLDVPCCFSVAGAIMKAADLDTPIAIKLLTAGSAACVADFASFPLDTAKVRLQVRRGPTVDFGATDDCHGVPQPPWLERGLNTFYILNSDVFLRL